jgi:tRNA modification GTPase
VIDTIFALSSGRPPAGIAIIRITGPLAFNTQRSFCGKPLSPRMASLVTLRDPATNMVLDRVLATSFVGPQSATGEDVIEWHCHGGHAVVQAVLASLGKQAGLREALPGEFTRRAFENGRIDLNEAEGLADLLSAETESQRRSALAMAEGHFSRRVDQWRAQLLDIAGRVEALLDFSDEDDVPGESDAEAAVKADLSLLAAEVQTNLSLPSAERIRDGIRTVIAGPPNAGKSTLLNVLVGRDAAIVSDLPGTTRDRIDIPVDLGGIAFLLTDTAGLREMTSDRIEAIGMDRTRSAMEQADIILWLGSPTQRPVPGALSIATQIDRADVTPERGHDLAISALTGQGMPALIEILIERAKSIVLPDADYALCNRQRSALTEVLSALDEAVNVSDLLIIAEILRLARAALDRLTGRAGVEDLLDSLFGRFCIGK